MKTWTGTVAPLDSWGVNGDNYVNSTTGAAYYKAGGTWTAVAGGTASGATLTGTTLAAGLIGTTGTTACAGNDSRLSDARTPTAHASTHQDGGADAVMVGTQTIPTANYIVPAGYSVVVSDEYEVTSALEIELASGAVLEVVG